MTALHPLVDILGISQVLDVFYLERGNLSQGYSTAQGHPIGHAYL